MKPRRSGDPAIAQRIVAAREAAGLTYKEVALQLPGRDQRYVYLISKTHHGIRAQDVAPLAKALGTTSCVLLGDGDHGIDGVLPGWGQLSAEQQLLLRQMASQMLNADPLKPGDSSRAAEEASNQLAGAEASDESTSS